MTNVNWIVLTIFNVIGSLIAPNILGHFTSLSKFESWVISGIIFLVLIGIELLIIAKDLLAIRTSEHRIWSEKDGFSALLISIRTDFQNMFVLEGEDASLIRQFIMQRVQKLRDDVHTAAEAKELYVADNHAIDTTKVTDLFRQRKARVYREVFQILDGGEIFNVYGRSYFNQIFDLSRSGDIEEVKALVVVDPELQASLDKANRLMSFYRTTQSYQARLISKNDFDKLRQDSGLEQCEDFGIYGEVLLFRTLGYDPSHGKYSYDSVKIRNHKNFFDACWNLPKSIELPAIERDLDLDEVLKL